MEACHSDSLPKFFGRNERMTDEISCHFEFLPKIFFGHNERMTNAEGNCHFDELARRNLLFKVRFLLPPLGRRIEMTGIFHCHLFIRLKFYNYLKIN